MERNYIGVDLHKVFFQACAVDATGARLWEGRFPRTPEGIAAFATRGLVGARIAVEAMGPTWKFVDAVQALEAVVCVVDPRKTKLKAGDAAKTDKLDARRLADALRRESVVAIYIPAPSIRDLRERCRGRHQLVRVRAKLVQAIRALLLRQDAGDPPVTCLPQSAGPAVGAGRGDPRGGGGRAAAPHPGADQCRHAGARGASGRRRGGRAGSDRARVEDLVGIGPVLALTLRAEIGTMQRFPTWPQLASYAGLVPRVEASAGRAWHGHITREGSPWLRWALVEAAIHAMRRPDRTGRWARQLAVRKSICPARVALARVLCRDIFRAWHAVEAARRQE